MKFQNSVRWTNSSSLCAKARRVAACVAKQAHRSQGAADAHVRSLEKRYGAVVAELRVYQCPSCRQWHVGRWRPGAVLAASAS